MRYWRAEIGRLLIDYFEQDNRRIEHAFRVLHHADRLMVDYPGCDEEIVIAAALLHDIGIKLSETELGYQDGATQEEYGPAVAGELLAAIEFPAEKTEIVKNIIGNHHSPSRYDYPELELLKAADLIVNRDEKV